MSSAPTDLLVEAFVRQWQARFPRDINRAQAELGLHLLRTGHPLPFDAATFEACIRRLDAERSARIVAPAGPPAQRAIRVGSRAARLDAYDWARADEPLQRHFVSSVRTVDGIYRIRSETEIDVSPLSWYDSFRLVRLADEAWGKANLRLYYLVGPDLALFRLNGTSPPIHEVNDKSQLKLTAANAASYLFFFCFFVRGEEGPFYLVESADDTALGDLALLRHPEAEVTRNLLASAVRPLECQSAADGGFACTGVVLYSNALFVAKFSLGADGKVAMLDDDPIAADLPLRINAPLA